MNEKITEKGEGVKSHSGIRTSRARSARKTSLITSFSPHTTSNHPHPNLAENRDDINDTTSSRITDYRALRVEHLHCINTHRLGLFASLAFSLFVLLPDGGVGRAKRSFLVPTSFLFVSHILFLPLVQLSLKAAMGRMGRECRTSIQRLFAFSLSVITLSRGIQTFRGR
ncbi:hypothetical protein B0T26DRAFT_311191 [Lasiosphaeria miniovina]|uniref:Transmembrane protein n=1 Tax=Lasiosphaeria miniovina TaxID=1954250 RepID=A0AA40ALI3_9PEZI|nr:uncharacterized protein B0T26DRAFT_311191 [Lasiosphaeria miniovina]KAK0718063.1 hypothetical protein B0T26DRAFT_311191 [Lasiosphaeria miniovina]